MHLPHEGSVLSQMIRRREHWKHPKIISPDRVAGAIEIWWSDKYLDPLVLVGCFRFVLTAAPQFCFWETWLLHDVIRLITIVGSYIFGLLSGVVVSG